MESDAAQPPGGPLASRFRWSLVARASSQPPSASGGHSRAARTAAAAAAAGFLACPTPQGFECSLTREIMRDPVMTSDGLVFDRPAISEWLRANAPDSEEALVPLPALQAAIEAFFGYLPDFAAYAEEGPKGQPRERPRGLASSELRESRRLLLGHEVQLRELRQLLDQKDQLVRSLLAALRAAIGRTAGGLGGGSPNFGALEARLRRAEAGDANLGDAASLARQSSVMKKRLTTAEAGDANLGDAASLARQSLVTKRRLTTAVGPRFSVDTRQSQHGRRSSAGAASAADPFWSPRQSLRDPVLPDAPWIRRRSAAGARRSSARRESGGDGFVSPRSAMSLRSAESGSSRDSSRGSRDSRLSGASSAEDGGEAAGEEVRGSTLVCDAEIGDLGRVRRGLAEAAAADVATALLVAAGNGHLDIVQHLCEEAGADRDDARRADGSTPLCLAAAHGHLAVVRYLCEGRADVSAARNDGCAPLCIAAAYGQLGVVRYLADEAGADADDAGKDGSTALFHAAAEGRLEVVRHLCEARADLDRPRRKDGATALCIAAAHTHLEVVQCLCGAGADMSKGLPDSPTPASVARHLHRLAGGASWW